MNRGKIGNNPSVYSYVPMLNKVASNENSAQKRYGLVSRSNTVDHPRNPSNGRKNSNEDSPENKQCISVTKDGLNFVQDQIDLQHEEAKKEAKDKKNPKTNISSFDNLPNYPIQIQSVQSKDKIDADNDNSIIAHDKSIIYPNNFNVDYDLLSKQPPGSNKDNYNNHLQCYVNMSQIKPPTVVDDSGDETLRSSIKPKHNKLMNRWDLEQVALKNMASSEQNSNSKSSNKKLQRQNTDFCLTEDGVCEGSSFPNLEEDYCMEPNPNEALKINILNEPIGRNFKHSSFLHKRVRSQTQRRKEIIQEKPFKPINDQAKQIEIIPKNNLHKGINIREDLKSYIGTDLFDYVMKNCLKTIEEHRDSKTHDFYKEEALLRKILIKHFENLRKQEQLASGIEKVKRMNDKLEPSVTKLVKHLKIGQSIQKLEVAERNKERQKIFDKNFKEDGWNSNIKPNQRQINRTSVYLETLRGMNCQSHKKQPCGDTLLNKEIMQIEEDLKIQQNNCGLNPKGFQDDQKRKFRKPAAELIPEEIQSQKDQRTLAGMLEALYGDEHVDQYLLAHKDNYYAKRAESPRAKRNEGHDQNPYFAQNEMIQTGFDSSKLENSEEFLMKLEKVANKGIGNDKTGFRDSDKSLWKSIGSLASGSEKNYNLKPKAPLRGPNEKKHRYTQEGDKADFIVDDKNLEDWKFQEHQQGQYSKRPSKRFPRCINNQSTNNSRNPSKRVVEYLPIKKDSRLRNYSVDDIVKKQNSSNSQQNETTLIETETGDIKAEVLEMLNTNHKAQSKIPQEGTYYKSLGANTNFSWRMTGTPLKIESDFTKSKAQSRNVSKESTKSKSKFRMLDQNRLVKPLSHSEEAAFQKFFRKLPKAELDVQLEGTLDPDLLWLFSTRNKVNVPFKNAEDVKKAFNNLKSGQDFINISNIGLSVIKTEQDFYDLTFNFCDKIGKQGVTHIELKWLPTFFKKQGIPIEAQITGIKRGQANAMNKFGMTSSLIATLEKYINVEEAITIVEDCGKFAGDILGISSASPDIGFSLNDLVLPFKKARKIGFKLIVDLGDEDSFDDVKKAIDYLQVDRLDNGAKAQKNKKSMDYIIISKTPIVVSLVGIIKKDLFENISEFNVKKIYDKGCLIVQNSENPGYYGGSYLAENYDILESSHYGFSIDDYINQAKLSFKSSFITKDDVEKPIKSIDNFVIVHRDIISKLNDIQNTRKQQNSNKIVDYDSDLEIQIERNDIDADANKQKFETPLKTNVTIMINSIKNYEESRSESEHKKLALASKIAPKSNICRKKEDSNNTEQDDVLTNISNHSDMMNSMELQPLNMRPADMKRLSIYKTRKNIEQIGNDIDEKFMFKGCDYDDVLELENDFRHVAKGQVKRNNLTKYKEIHKKALDDINKVPGYDIKNFVRQKRREQLKPYK